MGNKKQQTRLKDFKKRKKIRGNVLFLRDFRHLKRQIERKMQSSDPYGPSPKSGKTSESDFNAMLLRNKAMLWHVCSDYNIGMAWNTEDCMQEVIISLWNAYGTFEGRSSEKTWVYRVATNTMLMLRRKMDRSPQTTSIDLDTNDDRTVEMDDEDYQQLLQLIDALPEKDGIAIRAFLDGFSYKEVAEMTGSSVGAVAMRIARTKRKLKQMYDKENNTNK